MLRPLSSILESRRKELVQIYEDVAAGIPIISSIPTGIKSFDDYGVGTPGFLTLVQAHPGDGKTPPPKQPPTNTTNQGYRPQAHIFEDPEEYFADGLFARELDVSAYKLRRGDLKGDIIPRLDAAMRDMSWAGGVLINTEKNGYREIIEEIADTVKVDTGFFAVDYAQLFDAEMDEKSVERILSRLAEGLSKVCKDKRIAGFLFSQIKNEVEQRGRKHYDACLWAARKEGNGKENDPEPFWVEGYRPLSNDAQWCNAMYQKCKDILSWFRPGNWMKKHGWVDWPDNTGELLRVKGNYTPGGYPVRVRWKGETTTISDFPPSKKK